MFKGQIDWKACHNVRKHHILVRRHTTGIKRDNVPSQRLDGCSTNRTDIKICHEQMRHSVSVTCQHTEVVICVF